MSMVKNSLAIGGRGERGDGLLDPFLSMFVEQICNVLLWCPTLDILLLHLLYNLNGVFADLEKRASHSAIFYRPCRSDEDNEVWNIWDTESEVPLFIC
jgi:hypothetical protein